jgi:hypothetical protein
MDTLLYTVSYGRDDYREDPTTNNSVVSYDSNNTAPVKVVLRPVSNTVRAVQYKTSKSNTSLVTEAGKYADAEANASGSALAAPGTPPKRLPLNLFYCSPLRSLASEIPTTEQMTVCLDMETMRDVDLGGSATPFFNNQIRIELTRRADGTVRVAFNLGTSPAPELIVPADAKIIATYSMNLLFVTSYVPNKPTARGRLQMRRWAVGVQLRVNDPSVFTASGAFPPGSTRPDIDRLTIPNLLDVIASNTPGVDPYA